MKKLFLAICVLLSGCTSVLVKQGECENKFSSFSDIVSCTKNAFTNDIRAKGNEDYKYYILKGEQLTEKVKAKELTDLDAKVAWHEIYLSIKNRQLNKDETNARINAMNRPKPPIQTNCNTIGTTTNCTTN